MRDPDILASAARCFVDTVAAMAAGCESLAVRETYAVVSRFGAGHATVVGRQERLAPVWAAMINGVAAHAEEMDDNFLVAGTHGSAVLVPALVALGEDLAFNGHALLDAFVIGLQVQWRLSEVMNPNHGGLGWHPTSTLGTTGCAAACARLMGLDQTQTGAALSLSASMMGGTNAQFGSRAKPFHAGLAAHHGLMAAYLAGGGLSAGAGALEGEQGIIRLMGGDAANGAQPEDFGHPLAFDKFGVAMKLWPTCGSTHPPIDAALKALSARPAEDIERIVVTLPEILDKNLKFKAPADADQARFSLEFSVASALLDGQLTLTSIEDAARARASLGALMERVERIVIGNDFERLEAEVAIVFNDGSRQVARSGFNDLVGTKGRPLSPSDLTQKLIGCARGRLDPVQARQCVEALMSLTDDVPLADITPWLRLPTSETTLS